MITLFACSLLALAPAQGQGPTSASFVTIEGKDTISIEQYSRVGNTITGTWVAHQSGTQVHDYVLTLGPDGMPARYEMRLTVLSPPTPAPLKSVTVVYGPDSATSVMVGDSTLTRRAPMRAAYPWLGRSVMALELALARLRAAHEDSTAILANPPAAPTFVARPIPVQFFSPDSVRVAGVAWARLDPDGRLLSLRSGPSLTRRVPSFDVAKVVAGFAAADGQRLAAEAAAAAARVEVHPPAAALQRLVGVYSRDGGVTMTVALQDDTLRIQLAGQPALPIYALSPTSFFLKVVDATGDFELDAGGQATALIIAQHGGQQRFTRNP